MRSWYSFGTILSLRRSTGSYVAQKDIIPRSKCSCTAKLPRNVKKINSQATGSGGSLSVPEVGTVVERSNLVQNGQIQPSSCLKTAFVCILLHLRAWGTMGGKQKCPTYVGESCEENKNDPIPRVALSQRAELFWHALHSGHDGGAVCWLAHLFAFSSLFLFFSLSPLLLSPFCFQKTDLGKDALGKESQGWYGWRLGSICGLWTR